MDELPDEDAPESQSSGGHWLVVLVAVVSSLPLYVLLVYQDSIGACLSPQTTYGLCMPLAYQWPFGTLILMAIVVGNWGSIWWLNRQNESYLQRVDDWLVRFNVTAFILLALYGTIFYPLEWRVCEGLFDPEVRSPEFRVIFVWGRYLYVLSMTWGGLIQYRTSEYKTQRLLLRWGPPVMCLVLNVLLSLYGCPPPGEPPELEEDPIILPPGLCPTC